MSENDPYEVWNGEKYVFTLRKISQIGKIRIPDAFQSIIDKPIDTLTYDKSAKVNPGKLTVIMLINPILDRTEAARRAKEGAVVISCYKLTDENQEPLPCIVLPTLRKVRRVWDAIGEYTKMTFKRPTISITGSVGKTTTTLFTQSIFGYRHKVFVSGRNRNGARSIVRQLINRWGPGWDYHVQEVGGAAPKVVERSAKILHSDAFIITNIYPHHLDKYKTMEGILYDKTSFERVGDEGLFGVINYDDELLRAHPFQCRVVSFAIDNKEADYTADHIRQDGAWLKFDVHIKATGKDVPVSINIMGVHNVYNALAAFAAANEMGLSEEEITGGLAAYRSQGIRQVVREVSGRTLYIDCFNVSAESIRTCVKTLEEIQKEDAGRRIAVIGGENGLGEFLYDVNYQTGMGLSDFKDVDEFVFVGPAPDAPHELLNFCGNGWAVYQGACETIKDRPLSFYDSLVELGTWLREKTSPGDIILFKGIFRKPMYGAIDLAFGTGYLSEDGKIKYEAVQEGPCSGKYYAECEYTDLTAYAPTEPVLTIPARINGHPLLHIGKEVFRANKTIEEVHFGDTLLSVGVGAFRNCSGITELHVPANVRFIDESAFHRCRNLKTVDFGGIEHIEAEAFSNCKALQQAVFADSCKYIAPDAFKDCENLRFSAPEGSYAQAYAKEHGIPCE